MGIVADPDEGSGMAGFEVTISGWFWVTGDRIAQVVPETA